MLKEIAMFSCRGYNSKPGCRASFPESLFTRSVLGHMFLQQITPQGLKCAATAIQGFQLGKLGMRATVVAPLNPMGRDAGIARLFCFRSCHKNTAIKSYADFIETDSDIVPCPVYSWRRPEQIHPERHPS